MGIIISTIISYSSSLLTPSVSNVEPSVVPGSAKNVMPNAAPKPNITSTTTANNTNTHKIVSIQKLDPVDRESYNHNRNVETAEEHWYGESCSCESFRCVCDIKVLHVTQNCESNVRVRKNAFFDTFCQAYDNHGDVMISPDDVWMVICLYFSKYVNDNAELMRDKIVSHQGKKKLRIVTSEDIEESQWNEFFEKMMDSINKNTKGDIVDLLQCNFSSTGNIEKILSTATIMDTFKQYFSYARCIPLCGINNVHFAGSLEDWQKVLTKLKSLEEYAVTRELSDYIENLSPVIQKFIDTYEEKVDVDFWNRVVNIRRGSLGSGSTPYISGWILSFFGLSGEVEDIPLGSVNVEIEIDNRMTGVQKTVNLLGGFSGINKTGNVYKPQMSLAVIHKKN
jgi:hypothetical protein